MRAILVAGAIALAVSGCGAPVQGTDAQRAKPVVINAQPPANLPRYLAVYPGARIVKSVSNARGGMVIMETDAGADTVVDFYRAAAARAGLRSRFDSRKLRLGIRIGRHVVVFSAAGKGRFSASVEEKRGLTKVDLLYAS